VVRHRVVRRLRALVAARLPDLPDGARLVVRALPPAADASSSVLALDLDAALRRAASRRGTGPAAPEVGAGVVTERR
jgi:ribonuclease P protein component